MCSNTGSSACGCETGGNGAGSWSSGLRKPQKHPRVAKRGPGVAELEKILREQERIDITDRGNVEGFSSSCFIPHHSNSFLSSSLKSHPTPTNLPTHVPSAPKFDHLGPTKPSIMTPICGPLGRNGGSGLVWSEQELFPKNLSSCRSKSILINEEVDGNQFDSGNSPSRNLSSEFNHIWSYPATIQKRNNQYPPLTMNQFTGAGTCALTSSGSLPIGVHNHLEPPSNQNSYYSYTSRAREEHKDRMEEAYQRSESSGGESKSRPFYNFLEVEESEWMSPDHGGREAGGGCIDLSLKL
ncbi:uncharacterized protein LOC133301626 [Gastrolobium bilobum]|uniref:uncharacterized protein LOC133301626 n=1 Tax=Gastrolobium bilobum TaxID=150636 RepID=UPI002AB024FF|nr:uncharacterized protein LOC133301626 [Gastrolobium bilobum]